MQEYMGYCLIPTTKGQQMLFLVGKGGEGKSRVGLVMRALLGDNMNTGSIQKVEISPFARADLEHLLVMVDDDMKLEALPQTNHIKTIVTAELPLDLERKGKQSYQGWLFSRFMVFGNGTMKSLYDRSEGFFRRQLILSVRDKDKHREDDPFLAEKLCSEAEGILLWALEGLRRLIAQNYHFTVSERTKANRETAIKEGNNIVEFMESEGYFLFKADAQTTSKDFYAVYELWCSDNSEKPMTCGKVEPLRKRKTFDQIGDTFEFTTANGAEKAYHRAVNRLARNLAEDNAIRIVTVRQKEVTRKKKIITTATYEYQADCDGKWGEIQFDFEAGTTEIVRLADWDTTISNVYAKKAIEIILESYKTQLPKEMTEAFGRN